MKEGIENPAVVDTTHIGVDLRLGRILLRHSYKRVVPSTRYEDLPMKTITFVLDRKRAEDIVTGLKEALLDVP